MRPSDEHQHRSKRPNLFSTARARDGAHGDILARLERLPAEPHAMPTPRSRLLFLSTAGLLIAALIATLATVARDNADRPGHVQAGVATVAAAPAPIPSAPTQSAIVLDTPPVATDEIAAPTAPPPARAQPAPSPRPPTPAVHVQDKRLAFKAPARKAPRRAAAAAPEDPDVAILTAILSQAPRPSPSGPAETDCARGPGPACAPSQF